MDERRSWITRDYLTQVSDTGLVGNKKKQKLTKTSISVDEAVNGCNQAEIIIEDV